MPKRILTVISVIFSTTIMFVSYSRREIHSETKEYKEYDKKGNITRTTIITDCKTREFECKGALNKPNKNNSPYQK